MCDLLGGAHVILNYGSKWVFFQFGCSLVSIKNWTVIGHFGLNSKYRRLGSLGIKIIGMGWKPDPQDVVFRGFCPRGPRLSERQVQGVNFRNDNRIT